MLAYRLSLALGLDVETVLGWPERKLAGYAAHQRADGPVGGARLDVLLAFFQELFAKAHGDKHTTAEDWLPPWRFDPDEEEETVDGKGFYEDLVWWAKGRAGEDADGQ